MESTSTRRRARAGEHCLSAGQRSTRPANCKSEFRQFGDLKGIVALRPKHEVDGQASPIHHEVHADPFAANRHVDCVYAPRSTSSRVTGSSRSDNSNRCGDPICNSAQLLDSRTPVALHEWTANRWLIEQLETNDNEEPHHEPGYGPAPLSVPGSSSSTNTSKRLLGFEESSPVAVAAPIQINPVWRT